MHHPNHLPRATLLVPAAISNGGSGPQVFDFDDHVLRLVKWHPSSHGPAATYSELAASRLAQLIGAPAVRGSIVHVDPRLSTAAPTTNELHVGFTYLPGKNLHAGEFRGLENDWSFPAAAALLSWLMVGDQEGHNQYIWRTQEPRTDGTFRDRNEMVLVDLSLCFSSWEWTAGNFPAEDAAYRVPRGLAECISFSACAKPLALITALADDEIRSCFTGYPESWGIPNDAADLATGFLLARRKSLAKLLKDGIEV